MTYNTLYVRRAFITPGTQYYPPLFYTFYVLHEAVPFIASKSLFVTRFCEPNRFNCAPNGTSFLILNHINITRGEALHTLTTIFFHFMAT